MLALARYRLPPPPVPDPTGHTTAPSAPIVPAPTVSDVNQKASVPASRSGYWTVAADGVIHAFGDANNHGDPHAALGGPRAVHLAPTATGNGYWILDNQGRVHPFGDATKLGDVLTNKLAEDEQPASLSATPSGQGYWVFTNRGRATAFGDAPHLGDMSVTKLNGPVLGSVATPSGRGYYMATATSWSAPTAASSPSRRRRSPVRSATSRRRRRWWPWRRCPDPSRAHPLSAVRPWTRIQTRPPTSRTG